MNNHDKAAEILAAVRAGTHHSDIRKAGEMLDGRFDQDFPTWLLKNASGMNIREEYEVRALMQDDTKRLVVVPHDGVDPIVHTFRDAKWLTVTKVTRSDVFNYFPQDWSADQLG